MLAFSSLPAESGRYPCMPGANPPRPEPSTLLAIYQRRRDVADVVDRLADPLEPASQITAHTLRHYAAPGILERSESLAAAQDITCKRAWPFPWRKPRRLGTSRANCGAFSLRLRPSTGPLTGSGQAWGTRQCRTKPCQHRHDAGVCRTGRRAPAAGAPQGV
jgi:hypothetical protein